MSKAFLVILVRQGDLWSYETRDSSGAVVNFGSGYDDPGLAFSQASIFTSSLLAEHITAMTVIIPPTIIKE